MQRGEDPAGGTQVHPQLMVPDRFGNEAQLTTSDRPQGALRTARFAKPELRLARDLFEGRLPAHLDLVPQLDLCRPRFEDLQCES